MSAPVRPFCGDVATRLLLEVIGQEHPTIPSVAHAVGVSKSNAFKHLRNLRAMRLVDWRDGAAGTLRPLVAVVPRCWSSAPAVR